MKLLMISGDRSVLQGKLGAFFYTLQELRKHFDRIDVICPRVALEKMEIPESGHHFAASGSGGKQGEVYFHPCPNSLLFQVAWIVSKGKSLIAKHGHDVMTVHDYPPFYNSMGARKLHRKTGVPYAIEVHHIVGWPKAANTHELIGRLMTRFCIRRNAKRAAGVRVVNATVEGQLEKWGVPREKIFNVSSLYLDKDILTSDLRPPIAYDVSFCGRLVPNKGLENVIRAVEQIPEARLLIIGDGPERQPMEELADKLGIANRVTFLGWLPTQEAVIGAIQTARVFVMNSTSEGGPRIALEAMGSGMPVIVTPVGVMPEVIEDGKNGVITSGDIDDLKVKINELMQNEMRRESLATEAKKVLQTYERGELVKRYADFLKHLAV